MSDASGLPTYNVLFLCTGNSARSILAERLMDKWGRGRFKGFSAGSFPKGQVHPLAVKLLEQMGLPITGLRSKSWDEFARPGAPVMDFVFTVCDQAAGEVCPVWPGQPITGHWGVPDPAAAEGSEAERMLAFRETFRCLENRIKAFTSLPFEKLDRSALTNKVREIGRMEGASPGSANCAIPVTIYHNPACGTSRNVLGLIRNTGIEPTVIEYLKTPPSREELTSLIRQMGMPARALLREKGTPYHELGLDDPKWTDDELIDFILKHPILMNRPIVVTPWGVKLCRPSEAVLDILPIPQKSEFNKEDGERVIDAAGQRIASA